MALMTKQALLDICKEHKLYRSPPLNDKLYCNFKGFFNIANLEEYAGLRALFLEGNAIDTIEGLPSLPELKCLYLQQNCLWNISHLDGVPNLDTLNISHNHIKKLEGLSVCPNLATLIATDNQLETIDSITHLQECTNLHTLDIKNNKLSDPEALEVLKQLPSLKCLYLQGNPVVSNMKNYRKLTIAALPNLAYLDDRPVFEDERRMVTAWVAGGLDAERAERKLIREEKEEYDRKNFEAMLEIRRDGFRKRRERLGLPPGDTDPALDDLSDEEYKFEEEPPELVEARKRLAAYTSREGEEEPTDLVEARRKLAKEGGSVQQGVWKADPETDADIYFTSVKESQADHNGRLSQQTTRHDESDDGSPQRDVAQRAQQVQPQAVVEKAAPVLKDATTVVSDQAKICAAAPQASTPGAGLDLDEMD